MNIAESANARCHQIQNKAAQRSNKHAVARNLASDESKRRSMNNDRELIHAALHWHAAHVRRQSVGTLRRKLDKALKAQNGSMLFSPIYARQAEAARQLTEAKRKELAALRLLAKACAQQRGHLDAVDVIDLDIKAVLLTSAECVPALI